MAKKKSVWEVYLRPNTLTKENDRDCIADVHAHAATQRNEDIAELITKERSEFRKETIINILNMRDKAVKDLIQEGISFMDGLVQISPRVSGVWATENAPYDEKVHKRTVDIIIEGNKLKIDETDASQGVFFRLADGTEHKVTRRLSVNQPSQIIARVPATVPAGKVTVVVKTKFLKGKGTLKEMRTIVYGYPCTAKV